MSPLTRRRTTLLLALAAAGSSALAQERSESLGDLSLEDLMNESVTSATKKQIRLGDAPTAISVITQEDIRRSAYNSIPELLRLVPGLDVARIDGNEWAISSRGFNGQYASSLLVLIDGRTVYTPASGGVYWNVQDLMLEDIDRIEVIRGPGAALWGANAVNGVINIITKVARETQGVLLSVTAGDTPTVGARYGGELGSQVQYRGYVKYFDRQPFVDPAGQDVPDGQNAIRGGGRLDWQSGGRDSGTLQAEYYDADSHKPVTLTSFKFPYTVAEDMAADNRGGDILGNWTRSFSSTSQLTVQSYFQHFEESYGFGVEHDDSYDIEFQHHIALGARNDVVWGAGYRYTTVRDTPTSSLVWTPETFSMQLSQMFLQDEITLVPGRWHVLLGSKLEHNNLTGLEVEPSARLLWTPNATQTVWAAISSATTTPSLFERTSQLNAAVIQPPSGPPVWVELLGNPRIDVQNLLAYELGYRIEPGPSLAFDVASYYNIYRDVPTYISNGPVFEVNPAPAHVLVSSTFQNADRGDTYGLEISAQWQVLPYWRLTGSYTGLRMHTRPDSTLEGDSPQQQGQLRSYLDLPRHIEINAAASYVDCITVIPTVTPVRIPSYVRVDLGATWHPSGTFEIGVWGRNLLQSRHAEFVSDQTPLQVEIPRSILVRATWHF